MAKLRYFSASVERSVSAPRAAAWDEAVAMARRVFADAVDVSVESPWRFVYEMPSGSRGLGLWQGTLLLRDDGEACHVAWSLVLHPEPADVVTEQAPLILSQMESGLDEVVHRFA